MKTCTSFEEELQVSSSDIDKIKALVDVLTTRYESLTVLDQEIGDILLQEDGDMDEEQAKIDQYSLKYFTCYNKAQKLFEGGDSKSATNVSVNPTHNNSSNQSQHSYKLPLLKLKEFSGDLADWLPWWGHFEKIHCDETLEDIDKLSYLTMCMTTGSPAQQLVASFPATQAMYPEVIKALTARYGRKDLLVEFYVRELLKLVIQNTASSNKLPLVTLYDKLQSHLRNLESLKVSSETCGPFLLPLVSSCLSEDVLKRWECNSMSRALNSNDQLQSLLDFLRIEVEGCQKLELAKTSFGLGLTTPGSPDKPSHSSKKHQDKPRHVTRLPSTSTAQGLVNTVKGEFKPICLFCEESHYSTECKQALKMSLSQRQDVVRNKKACFACMKFGHQVSKCRIKHKLKCETCGGKHLNLLCTTEKVTHSFVSTRASSVLLHTLVVQIRNKNSKKTKLVRLLIDTGSQQSYILEQTAQSMGYTSSGQEAMKHALFGGSITNTHIHNKYCVDIENLEGTFLCNLVLFGQTQICSQISSLPSGPWLNELKQHSIELSDVQHPRTTIDILIGADVAAKLWTGRKLELSSGLVAMETSLGWTLSGKLPNTNDDNTDGNVAMLVTSLLIKEANINDLWDLDTLGIKDPTEKVNQEELDRATQEHFLKTVKINEEGRYEVRLPFLENHPPLSSNYKLSEKRLESTLKKLRCNGYEAEYGKVIEGWLEKGIIEKVPDTERGSHYLPHHPVIKLGSTTPVRPVFDASAREGDKCSLNLCLQKGPNLLEKVTSSLAKFRKNKIGVTGDIEKAFLQISVHERDRDFLCFIWRDDTGQQITYRHCRVVFGVSASPFLLESCIQLHLQDTLKASEEGKNMYSPDLVTTLRDSFYVDNCLVSVSSFEEAQRFVHAATAIMSERKFNLRGWEMSGENGTLNILGLDWDKDKDTLSISTESVRTMKFDEITKKKILSAAHRLFDPPGFISPVVLVPKILLQRTWEENLGWNEPVSEDTRVKFLQWLEEIPCLEEVKIPRWAMTNESDGARELHIFSDASKSAYAAVIFLRVRNQQDDVQLHLLGSKARVAPTSKTKKGMTIPRLELLAALIAARLFSTVVKDYSLRDVQATFWTDASTVLAWLARPDDPWDVYVRNRVQEIMRLTRGDETRNIKTEWKHVPGELNPADIASRGCSPKKFVESKWWEGPKWLENPPETWPQSEVKADASEVNKERRRTVVSAPAQVLDQECKWYNKFSQYKKIVRTIGWVLRFSANCKYKIQYGKLPESRDLTAEEYKVAEEKVLWLCQKEGPLDMEKLNHLSPFVEDGLIRLKTKISHREDDKDFCHPIVLPGMHPVVQRLVLDEHKENCHAGTQILLSILRQRYWITGGRRIIRTVLNTCVTCKRFSSKHIQTEAIPLPLDRVRDAQVFEVTGVDFAGPLFIRNDSGDPKKVWVCLFTCAVYRAVRLELVDSMSTDSFIMALKRFCSRQNRPKIMYSDNGSNLTSFKNVSEKLDWDAIASYSSARKIEWRLIPPASPWWGGWWERLIGVTKSALKKVLGRTYVNQEVLQTILCDIESIINLRPLTYLSEDPTDLAVLTPAMFLHEIQEVGVPEWDLIQPSDLRKRYEHRQELVRNLRVRFRSEYLGQLKLFANKKSGYEIKSGDMVLIGDDNQKRIDWPIGLVTELITGRDSVVRVVRVRTSKGTLTRPVQRIYPLEFHLDPDNVSASESDKVPDHCVGESDYLLSRTGIEPGTRKKVDLKLPSVVKKDTKVPFVPRSQITRSGRKISRPSRFSLSD